MPAPSRAPGSVFELRRQRWLRDRTAARTLRSAFPGVERIRVDLTFRDTAAVAPGAQSHAVHPAARAFFEFLCPHADCDGTFDLTAAVNSVMTASPGSDERSLRSKSSVYHRRAVPRAIQLTRQLSLVAARSHPRVAIRDVGAKTSPRRAQCATGPQHDCCRYPATEMIRCARLSHRMHFSAPSTSHNLTRVTLENKC
jgi:hypothetical protein